MAGEMKNEFELEDIAMNDAAEAAKKEIAIEKGEIPPEKKEEEKKEVKDEGKEEGKEESDTEKAEKVKADELKQKEKEAKELAKKKEEEDNLLKTDDKDLDEDKRYKKIAIQKIRDDETKKKEDDAVKMFADKHKLSVDDARKELEHITKIKEKYKDDDKELPLAYLNIQRQNTKLSEDLKRHQEAAPVKSIEKLSDEDIVRDVIDTGKITIKGKPATREQILEAYRSSHQKQTENQDDEAVLCMVAGDIRQGLIHQKSSQLQEMKLKAKDKRIEVINAIPEKDKEFTEIVKELVSKHSDEAILSESFSVQDIIRWAKGEKYDDLVSKHADEVKKAHDDGFAKGRENAKILGAKETVTAKESSKGAKTVSLTDRQKKEALDMFDLPSMTDEEKYESYIEVKGLKQK
jgi:hypothetical protein